MGAFKEPHGGVLKELYLGESAAEEEKVRARDYHSWDLTQWQLCDIELILNGSFSPLDGFLRQADYDRVVAEMRLTSGLALCAPIAPYTATRRKVRQMIEATGGFVEIFVATPIEICEQRDRKGLYAKARAGLIKGFTGIDDPYEEPENAEVVIETKSLSPELAAQRILVKLESLGYIR